MNFESGGIYHIYNQGNNRQLIFFKRENYLFFMRKIEVHLLPYADILAWCLMPNHFHLMVEVRTLELPIGIDRVSESHPVNRGMTFNASIGIMLRSYTRAVNIQEKRSGSLFREETKAICLNESNGIAPSWYSKNGVTMMNVEIPEFQYPQVCFNYIHANPVKSGLVDKPEDWEFSSFADIKERKQDGIVNLNRVIELGLILFTG